MLRPGFLGIIPCIAALVTGCAYPRRSTSLVPAHGDVQSLDAPADVWRIRFLEGRVPPKRRGGLDWDPDGGLPDVVVRLYRDNQLVYETPVQSDTLEPTFDSGPSRNVWLPRNQELRIEMWDRDDGLGNDPIGVWRGAGLPSNALPNADARVNMENGAWLMFRVMPPRAHRGVGVSSYEVRGDALHVLEVIEHSPAGRAGLAAGDRIVAIGGRRIEDLSEAQVASALSMASERGESLTVVKTNGRREEVELDRGYVWLAM